MSDMAMSSVPYLALTKTEVAYKQLRRDIVEGVLEPDTILDQEALATRLGLSTTPVREALRLLESENLVISRRHRNTVVAPLDLDQLKETYAVRTQLDPYAVALGAKAATQPERDAIWELLLQAEKEQSPIDALHTNRALHRAMYNACRNAVLIQLLDNLWDRCDRYRVATLNDESQVRVANDDHRRIVTVFNEGKADEAAQLMREHITASLDRIDPAAFPSPRG